MQNGSFLTNFNVFLTIRLINIIKKGIKTHKTPCFYALNIAENRRFKNASKKAAFLLKKVNEKHDKILYIVVVDELRHKMLIKHPGDIALTTSPKMVTQI